MVMYLHAVQHLVAELALGNVSTNQSLYELWHSEAMNNLRKIHKAWKIILDNPNGVTNV